jgi:hypothetical protein
MNIIRTKMASALIGAVHASIDSGCNTGRIGAQVLTHEAKGTGVIYRRNVERKLNGIHVVTRSRQVAA